MRISYCTTCHGRLWQLKQTLKHNLAFAKADDVELCIVTYNDADAYEYLHQHYADYILDGRLRVINHVEDKVFADGSRWSCGYVKDIAHRSAIGDVLFNLDADNFIDDDLHDVLLKLQPNELLITLQPEWQPDGRSGRIGVHSKLYSEVQYQDKGRNDDGQYITQCINKGAIVKQIKCKYKPISNIKY